MFFDKHVLVHTDILRLWLASLRTSTTVHAKANHNLSAIHQGDCIFDRVFEKQRSARYRGENKNER